MSSAIDGSDNNNKKLKAFSVTLGVSDVIREWKRTTLTAFLAIYNPSGFINVHHEFMCSLSSTIACLQLWHPRDVLNFVVHFLIVSFPFFFLVLLISAWCSGVLFLLSCFNFNTPLCCRQRCSSLRLERIDFPLVTPVPPGEGSQPS